MNSSLSSLSSASASSYSSASSISSESISADKFWNQYKRGRSPLSLWRMIKHVFQSRGKRNVHTCEVSKEHAISNFYKQLHQQSKLQEKDEHHISLNEYYGPVFVKNKHIPSERKSYTEKELLYTLINNQYSQAFYN